ncbi:MAG: Mut7-C RNAse domain-containing protein [Deltaproteobacteria bacterium]|nr:Mut7-C RNAse domain-containing protein [Deltaproteobacteria bacterium]
MQRFVADRMLGKLAKWLRVLGYDVVYLRKASEGEILQKLQAGRTLLTRNRRAQKWRGKGNVFIVKGNDPKIQLREVVKGLGLPELDAVIFSRCLGCNRTLDPVKRETVREEVPDYIYQKHEEFYRCNDCGKVYWHGSHAVRMRQQLQKMLED